MPQLRYLVIDAFTSRPFGGNPAAVIPLEIWPHDEWLQLVAREMNLSETAYIVREGDDWRLRWFTPAVEVDLCGHATVATAKAMWHWGFTDAEMIGFESRSGRLTATRRGTAIELDFPLKRAHEAEAPPDLLPALGMEHALYVGRNEFDYLVAVESADAVRRLAPDFSRLAKVAARGIMVTAPGDDSKYDFVSRFFAPAAGVNEDPATGSAHCCLVDYWHRCTGKTDFRAYQASVRGGELSVALRGERVLLGGEAVIMAEGMLSDQAMLL